jgi:hypothetical protein
MFRSLRKLRRALIAGYDLLYVSVLNMHISNPLNRWIRDVLYIIVHLHIRPVYVYSVFSTPQFCIQSLFENRVLDRYLSTALHYHYLAGYGSPSHIHTAD